MTWLPIATAPLDREIELRGEYIPSDEAARNGATRGAVYGTGRFLAGTWTNILGGKPTHWREVRSAVMCWVDEAAEITPEMLDTLKPSLAGVKTIILDPWSNLSLPAAERGTLSVITGIPKKGS